MQHAAVDSIAVFCDILGAVCRAKMRERMINTALWYQLRVVYEANNFGRMSGKSPSRTGLSFLRIGQENMRPSPGISFREWWCVLRRGLGDGFWVRGTAMRSVN